MKKNNTGRDQDSWPGNEARRKEAIYNFCKALDEDPALREKCLNKDLPDARDTFKKAGSYENMPTDVVVRAFEIEDEVRGDSLITIKLPKAGTLPPKDQLVLDNVWACTYSHWDQAQRDQAQQK